MDARARLTFQALWHTTSADQLRAYVTPAEPADGFHPPRAAYVVLEMYGVWIKVPNLWVLAAIRQAIDDVVAEAVAKGVPGDPGH